MEWKAIIPYHLLDLIKYARGQCSSELGKINQSIYVTNLLKIVDPEVGNLRYYTWIFAKIGYHSHHKDNESAIIV